MEFALMTEPQAGGTYDEILAAARWAEDRGLASFARSDHYLNRTTAPPATDAFATLAGLARDTSRIRLTVLVSPISFRHPAVIAKTAATISEMSGGRLELGVGTGWMQEEHDAFGLELWATQRERFERLYDALGYLRAAFAAEAAGFRGRHYNLDEIDVLPTPEQMRIIVGGSGRRKTPGLAGRFADEYNFFVTTPDDAAARIAVMREAAAEAGRDPESIRVSMMGPILADADAASYRERLAAAASARDRTPAEHEEILRSAGVPHGPADQAAAAIDALAAAGIDRYYLQVYAPVGDLDYDALAAFYGAVGA
jgi:alkanesulfonate monooxygenase SsuD/methylene tetrahydromethanopterin reductase-like flavin-dependent oxidoreductase (luciferase family)